MISKNDFNTDSTVLSDFTHCTWTCIFTISQINDLFSFLVPFFPVFLSLFSLYFLSLLSFLGFCPFCPPFPFVPIFLSLLSLFSVFLSLLPPLSLLSLLSLSFFSYLTFLTRHVNRDSNWTSISIFSCWSSSKNCYHYIWPFIFSQKCSANTA